MLRYCLILCFITSFAYGQGTIKGRVYEYKTRIALTDIQVQDINNKQLAITDDNGKYAIQAKVGDKLVFTGFSYQTDTVIIADAHEREVYLTPKQNMLNSVNVNSTAAPSTFKSYDPMYHGQSMIYKPGGGAIFRIWYWKKDEKRKARMEKIIADDKIRDQITTAFTATTVGRYIPIKGNELNDFVLMYLPDVKTYTDKNFTMLDYVNACYKKFMKLPPDKRHFEKLVN